MTLKNNRAPLLCCFQLCAWFHCHMWIQTGVRVRKRLSWVLTSVTLTFDLWPWLFAWTSLLTMVITPENFMMIRWWEHGEKGVTDRRTDGRTDRQTENTICRAAWSQLKKHKANLRDSIAATSLVILIKLDSNLWFFSLCDLEIRWIASKNKANLRDLIAATGLVILLKLDSNRRFFSLCDLEIWWMTPINNRACLLYYIKLCVSFHIHQWIQQTGVTVRKGPNLGQIRQFF